MLARGSGPWLIVAATATIVVITGAILSLHPFAFAASGLFTLVFLLLLLFFRDPERTASSGIVSPADGVVTAIEHRVAPPATAVDADDPAPVNPDDARPSFFKIEIFMNIHNVHVNRMPLDAQIIRMDHRSGGNRLAFDKDAASNERLIYHLHTALGTAYLVQIAGAFARRIVPYVSVSPGAPAKLKKGERLGLIRLGSRVDLYLPEGSVRPVVNVGSRVKANLSTIAIPVDAKECGTKECGIQAEEYVLDSSIRVGGDAV